MNTTSKKITYIASLDPELSPGVYKKILGTISGAKTAGYDGKVDLIKFQPDYLKLIVNSIDNSDADILIIRSLCQYNFYLIPALIKAKSKGKIVILDVPTPNQIAINELSKSEINWKRKFKDLGYLILSGPVPFWFTTRVLQYAEEGSWFSFGNRKKTLLLGNGIDVQSIPCRNTAPVFDGSRLDLICVASLNYWHGVDRLLNAISVFNSQDNQMKVYLKVVGEGAGYSSLIDLAKQLQIEEYVSFLGFLKGDSLHDQYSYSHLAVGSLGLYRKKLKSASELKSREYCAVGIPFIVAGDDPDFPVDTEFRKQLPNRGNIEDLTEFFENIDPSFISFSPEKIRDYAWKRLDFSVKIKMILKNL